jgi:Glutaredoxin-like domain (DUF836).
MKTVTLISKEDCHLCEVAKNVLLKAQKEIPFDLKEKKIAAGDPDFEKYHERIPVILIDEEFAFQYRVSERQLMEILEKKTFNHRGAQTPK